MTPDELAGLHAVCFTRPRPWTAAEFTALLAGPGAFLLTAPGGFLLGRTLAGEAELLTLAVAPDRRRQGVARDLVARFMAQAAGAGAACAFLEVASDNLPAQALYRAAGWRQVGVRRNYYAHGIDAVVMRADMAGVSPA